MFLAWTLTGFHQQSRVDVEKKKYLNINTVTTLQCQYLLYFDEVAGEVGY